MLTGNLDEVGASIVLAVIYLITVRFLDANEREPLWSVLLVFTLGAAAAATLHLIVDPLVLELDVLAGAAWREAAVFVALAVGIWLLSEIGRLRGWSEVTDLIDGLVYGMVAGLGFATGEALVRSLGSSSTLLSAESSAATMVAKTALAGLAQGVFGAITGIGFGLAAARRFRPRWIWPLITVAIAIAVHVAHYQLAYGNALGGASAVIRGWTALIVPLLCIVVLAVYEFQSERRVIARELADEVGNGYITDHGLATLNSFAGRQLEVVRAFISGGFARARRLAALHNRQVMLALAKRRLSRADSPDERTRTLAEVDALRRSIKDLSARLGLVGIVAIAILTAPPLRAQQGSADEAKVRSLIQSARDDINSYWTRSIKGYVPPADVLMIRVPTQTDCGSFPKPNAAYCAGTNKIYWDVGFFVAQYKIGDFAPVFILAHEWGHMVQRELGFTRTEKKMLTVQLELQADCFAGEYARDARTRKVLDPGDDDEAAVSLRRAGDGLDDPWFDTSAHGTAGQRIDAFTYGFDGKDCADDKFFEFLKTRGIDPSRVPQTQVANTGTLDSLLPRQTGRFGKFKMTKVTRFPAPGATDALEAIYTRLDGVAIKCTVAAYADPAFSRQVLDALVEKTVRDGGYREISRINLTDKQSGKPIGLAVVLQATNEVVMWVNNQVVAFVEGPRDATYELYSALPF